MTPGVGTDQEVNLEVGAFNDLGGGATKGRLFRGGVWTHAIPGEGPSLGTLRSGFGMGLSQRSQTSQPLDTYRRRKGASTYPIPLGTATHLQPLPATEPREPFNLITAELS